MARTPTSPRSENTRPKVRGAPAPTPGDTLGIDVPDALIAEALAAVDRATRPNHAPPESTPGLDAHTEPRVGGAVVDENDMLVVPPELADLLDPATRPDRGLLQQELAAARSAQGVAEERAGELEGQVVRERAEKERLATEVQRQGAELTRLRTETRELAKSRDALDALLREGRESHRQLAAEYQRLQQRLKRDREDAERNGEERGLRALIETADNLERAAAVAGGDTSPLARGIHMVVEQVKGQLRRLGVERVGAGAGVAFDPQVHEAVLHVPSTTVQPGSVLEEVAPGYRLRGRLLRPARVTVAAGPVPAPEAEVTITDEEDGAEDAAASIAVPAPEPAADLSPPPPDPTAAEPPADPTGAR